MIILDENELTKQYNKYVVKYLEIFKHAPYRTFEVVKINDSHEIILDFRENLANSVVLPIPSTFQTISDKILEFKTILSFLSPEILGNAVIYNLLYIFYFKNSEHIEIVKKRDELLNEFKEIFKQITQAEIHFVDAAIQIIPLESILSDFLVDIMPTISNLQIINDLRVYYMRFLSSVINIRDIRSLVQQQKVSHEWFQSQGMKKKNPLALAKSTNISSIVMTFALHYEKIGLNLYFIHVHFPNSSNTMRVIKKYFLPVPFLTNFILSQKRYFTFYAMMPEDGLINLEKYLNLLKNGEHINYFNISQSISSDQIIQLNKKYSGDTQLFKMKLFNSKKYSKTSLNNKRNSPFQENIVIYRDTVKYSTEKPIKYSNLKINSLFLYLFFKSREFFINFSNFQSIQLFLKYIQQNISDGPFFNIARKYPKINFLRTHFEKDQLHFHNSSVKKKEKSGSNLKYLKYLNLLDDLGFKKNPIIYNLTFDEIIKSPWRDINENFSKKSQFSRQILGNIISRLLQEGFIQESNILSMASILQIEKSTLPFFVISRKFIDWIQSVSFYHLKNDFHEVNLNSNKFVRQLFFISVSSYFLIFKWLLLEDLYAVNLFIEQIVKRIDEKKIINFFDFKYTNQWNPDLFNIDYLLEKKTVPKDRSLANQNGSLPFHLAKNIRKDKFKFKNFYRDLHLIGRLNEINKLVDGVNNQFKQNLCGLYRSNPLQITILKENLPLTKEQEILFESSFCGNLALNPALSSEKRIILIFNQPNSDLSPFLFIKDPLLQGFFQISLTNGWMFGGRYDATLILEYRKNISILENKKSEWNRFINSVKKTYPNLKINMFEVSAEERFFNTETFFPENWRDSEYLNFTPSNILMKENNITEKIQFNFGKISVSNNNVPILNKYLANQELSEEETELLIKSKILYYPRFFNWKFLQITGYSFTLVLIINNPERKKKKILDLLYQLPIGKILHLQNSSENSSKLCAILHLHENVLNLWSKFVSFLESMRVDYIISPILPLEVYDSTIFAKIINVSNIPFEFKFKKGEPLELPIFPLRMRREVYTPDEQICFFENLKERYPTGITDITRSRWVIILRDLKVLKEKSLIQNETVARILE